MRPAPPVDARGRRARATGAAAPVIAAAAALALLVGCTGGGGDATLPTNSDPAASPSTPGMTGAPTDTGGPTRDPWITLPGPVTLDPDGAETLASDLDAPWSVVRFTSGAALVSERDSGRLLEVLPGGSTREIATVPGVVHGGEGGLLGLAIAEDELLEPRADAAGAPPGTTPANTGAGEDGAAEAWLFAMSTAADGNRIVRFDVTASTAGAVAIGGAIEVLTGLPSGPTHNGGRLAIGPDGLLYATTGDAGDPSRAQDRDSLAGKILRLGLDGSIPADNPFGTAVYSMGHRNPQGLAWDRDGALWASEFGQNTWDELNRIEPGANYGWPAAEGIVGDSAFRDPVLQWPTSEASPSGLVWLGDTLFMASLRGERLWRIDLTGSEAAAEPLLVDVYGRIRDVITGPAESIWILTNNTDGRGTPGGADDRLVQLEITRS